MRYLKVERIMKAVANHNRLKVLELLSIKPELSVADLAGKLKIGYENASDHIRKLTIAGLVMKRSDGWSVRHKLTPRGSIILAFCKKLE